MLWLHIGLPKTGSSAIQAGLRHNRDALSRAGVFYAAGPHEDEAGDWRISSGNAVRLGRHLRAAGAAGAIEDDAAQAGFLAAFVSPDHPISLASSELLAGAAPDRLAAFRDQLADQVPVRILALVRDIHGDARSRWHQAIKRGGFDGGFVDFCRDHYVDAQGAALSLYAETFGREAMTVIHYDSVADRLMAAVLDAIGADAAAVAEPPMVNRSLAAVEAQVLAACNAMPGATRDLSRRLSDHLIYKHPTRTGATAVDAEAVELLRQRWSGAVAAINDAYFDGQPRLRVDGAPRSGGEEPDPAEVWRDVAEATLSALAERQAEIRDLTVQNLVLRGRERLRKGEVQAAHELLRRALDLDPQSQQALALLARTGAPDVD